MLGILEVATDIGHDSGTSVSPDYSVHASNFTGKIHWVQLDVGRATTTTCSRRGAPAARVVRLRPRWWGDERPAPSPRSRRTIAGSGHATMAPASCERVTVSFSTA